MLQAHAAYFAAALPVHPNETNALPLSHLDRILQAHASVQEPIAAAMAYGLGRGSEDEQAAILVFDLGGGTFDVCLLQSFDGILEVVASDGDSALGGIDIDHALADFMWNALNDDAGAHAALRSP
jgi:molecular chaperone DnaK